MCDIAKEVEGLHGTERAKAAKKHGVYGQCWLSLLHMFNIVWDITGDLMHLLKGTWGRRLMPMLKGLMTQAPPKEPAATHADGRGGAQAYTAVEMRARMQKYKRKRLEHGNVKQVHCNPL
jgi:hypothetical protein